MTRLHRTHWNMRLLWGLWLLCSCMPLIGCAHHDAIKNKVVVITGASSGFGKGVARKLADKGAHVVVAARRTVLLEEMARESGGRMVAVTTDVAKESDMERLAETALSTFGRIDVWINDAGVGAFGRFEEIPLADHVRLVQTNLIGVIYGSHFAMRQFLRQQSGTLINIASIAGKIGTPYYASYSATKFGVVGLGQALNQELRLNDVKNIHVCTILPIAANTPFFEHAANYTGHTPRAYPIDDPEDVVDAIVEAITAPKKEIAVGFTAKSSVFFHRMAPGMAENRFGGIIHKAQFEDALPALPTSGSVHQPMTTGTDVSGGMRERIAEEDRRSKQERQ